MKLVVNLLIWFGIWTVVEGLSVEQKIALVVLIVLMVIIERLDAYHD